MPDTRITRRAAPALIASAVLVALIVQPRDRLFAVATHGRGVWVMDAAPRAGRR
jgi:hypothetical protein